MSSYTPTNLFFEPWEADYAERGWTSSGIVSGGNYNPGLTNNAFFIGQVHGSPLSRPLATSSSYTLGFALTVPSLSGAPTFTFYRGANVQVQLALSSGGVWSLLVGSSTVWTAGSATITTSGWYYIELQVFCASSGGTIQLKQNQVTLTTYSGNTKGSSAVDTLIDTLNFTQTVSASQHGIDDLYLTWGSDSQFLGMVKLYQFTPQSDGTHVDYTPNSGSTHFSRVNQVPSDDDTTYVTDGTSGHADSYVFSTVSVTGLIVGVQPECIARKDQTGTLNYKILMRLSSTDYSSSAQESPTTSYGIAYRGTLLNPATGLAWVQSDITSGEFGTTIV